MSAENEEYVKPSALCDFDRHSRIREKAVELTPGCGSGEEMFRRLFAFVKELPYGLEDWDVPASETLRKGWGMCSGKTNLLVTLLRSLGIPARYRVFRIIAEASLWEWITRDDPELAEHLGAAPAEQDHVDCEVWLGGWKACDPSRDTPLEQGLRVLGIPLEREAVRDAHGHVPYLTLACFDQWARGRQEGRMFREGREETFARANQQFWRIRAHGKTRVDGGKL